MQVHGVHHIAEVQDAQANGFAHVVGEAFGVWPRLPVDRKTADDDVLAIDYSHAVPARGDQHAILRRRTVLCVDDECTGKRCVDP